MKSQSLGLVGDIGGTNCRFAVVDGHSLEPLAPRSYRNAEYASLEEVLGQYLAAESHRGVPTWAVIAAAGPVTDGEVALTNLDWRIAARDVAARFAIADVRLVNDFAALAASAPHVRASDLVVLNEGRARAPSDVATLAILGPGTGLGVGGLVCTQSGDYVLSTEGGHTTFAPGDDLERAIDARLRAWFGRVSTERVISGMGLANLYRALCEIEGRAPEPLAPNEVTARAAAGTDPCCVRAVQVFSAALGAFAGDVALTMGATSGVYLAGGLVPAILAMFDRAAFWARFETKGRYEAYMRAIPVKLITAPYAALTGAAALGRGLARA